MDCLIVDISISLSDRETPAGATLLATFTLISDPLRATGCKLMRKPDGALMIWTPHPSLKINQRNGPKVAKMVMDKIEAANVKFT
jgi:hypothetical protein